METETVKVHWLLEFNKISSVILPILIGFMILINHIEGNEEPFQNVFLYFSLAVSLFFLIAYRFIYRRYVASLKEHNDSLKDGEQ
jgi:hypothetical protein